MKKQVTRTLLYTFIGYGLWMTLIMAIHPLLPAELANSKFFVMMSTSLTSAFVVLFSVLYLRKVQRSTWREGLAVGLLATVTVILFDVLHNMLLGIDMKGYISQIVPSYFVIPLTTALIFGCLAKK